MVTIFDAEGVAIGRLGAKVAKLILSGESAVVINAEKAVITGRRRYIIEKYTARRAVKQKANPQHSPHWPRRPDMLVRRIIRGMLPFDRSRGREAYKRLRVYIGLPQEFQGKELKTMDKVSMKGKERHMTISELCKELGWQGSTGSRSAITS